MGQIKNIKLHIVTDIKSKYKAAMEPKQYVNGAMLPQNIGRSVCAVGKVVSNGTNGNEIKVALCDGKEVNVTLDGDQAHEPMDYIQMVATVNGNLSLMCQAYVPLQGEIDLDIYNQAIGIAAQYPNLFSASQVNGLSM